MVRLSINDLRDQMIISGQEVLIDCYTMILVGSDDSRGVSWMWFGLVMFGV